MGLFSKNKKPLAPAEPEVQVQSEEDETTDLNGHEFDLNNDYEEGLRLFMQNEGYDTKEEALKAVAKELDEIVKPKILSTRETTPVNRSNNNPT